MLEFKNTFEFVRCLKSDVRDRMMFNKMVFDSSLQKTKGAQKLNEKDD